MGVPITINGRELNVNDMAVEPGAEYLVTVGKTASSVKVERTDLKAENERLRRRYGECQNELTQTMCDYSSALDNIDKLRSENAKLRELVVQAHECKTNDGCCEDCYQDEGCCPIERDMEKLGI